MNEQDSIKALEQQAKNTKYLMDELNSAYLGFTTDEIIKMALIHRKDEEGRKIKE